MGPGLGIGLTVSFLLFAVLLSGCNFKIVPELGDKPEIVETKFSGDYETLKLRGMWAFCSQSFRTSAPYATPDMVAQICDCYVDEMRKTYNVDEIENLTENESKKMGQQLIQTCNPKSASAKI